MKARRTEKGEEGKQNETPNIWHSPLDLWPLVCSVLRGSALLCESPVPADILVSAHSQSAGLLPDIKPSAEMQMKETMSTVRTGQQQLGCLSAALWDCHSEGYTKYRLPHNTAESTLCLSHIGSNRRNDLCQYWSRLVFRI